MKQKKSIRYFLVLVILSLFIFLGERTGFLSGLRGGLERIFVPWQRGLYFSWQNFSGGTNFLTFWRNGQVKLNNCQERNRELLVKAARVNTLTDENKILKEQLGVFPEREKKFILARVIGFKSELKLDKGSMDGVRKGMIGVVGLSLVGKVIDVTSTTAKVELPVDSHSKIAVETSSTKAKGILNGRFNNELFLDSVLQGEELQLGDTVVTSGENGNFPPDLLVGKIVKIEKNETAVFQKASVEPVLNFSSLRDVFLIAE